jgi:outer membrane protein assembly factor BamA
MNPSATQGVSATMFGRVLAATLAASSVPAAAVAEAAPSYILNGYRLSGVNGVDQDALVATLTHKEGDRITDADIAADTKMLGDALKALHIEGQLFATTAEKNGRVWILFDFQYPPTAEHERRWLGSQIFDGNVKISSAALEAATGLKPGEDLPVERINAAREAILQAYKKAEPHADVHVGGKLRITPDGKVELTWHVTEPK